MKKIKHKIIFIFIPIIVLVSSSVAQINVNSVSFGFGIIHPFGSFHENEYVFYPELRIIGRCFLSYLDWSTYWGYSDDRVDEVRYTDAIVYSARTNIIGGRIAFTPARALKHWILPITIFGGISHHFISLKYIGGGDYDGNIGYDHNIGSNTLELGLKVYYIIVEPIEIQAEAHQFFGLGNDRWRHKGRRAYTLGIAIAI